MHEGGEMCNTLRNGFRRVETRINDIDKDPRCLLMEPLVSRDVCNLGSSFSLFTTAK